MLKSIHQRPDLARAIRLIANVAAGQINFDRTNNGLLNPDYCKGTIAGLKAAAKTLFRHFMNTANPIEQ